MYQKCKKNVLAQFQSIRNLPKNSQAKSCVLVLDTKTAPLLSDLLSLQQLLQIGIRDLCRVDRIKKPEPTATAIYFIQCKSLQFLYRDFNKSNKNIENNNKQQSQDQHSQRPQIDKNQQQQQKSLYFSINLLLCEQASKDILRDISQHEQIIDKLASFGQLYISCKYTASNIGIIPFSKITYQHIQKLRKFTNLQSKLQLGQKQIKQKDKQKVLKQEQEQKQQNNRKRQHTVHNIHKNNLSCLPDIYFYQFQKNKNSKKQIQKHQRIDNDLKSYGSKLCQSVVAGINIGLTTVIKIVCYDSKFSQRVKQSFIHDLTQYIQNKANQLHQMQLDQSMGNQKGSIFRDQSNGPEAKQVTIIIADRQVDNISPLVRNFYYGPLLMDVFDIKDPPDRKIRIISKKIQPTVMQNDDKILNSYKNMFINEVFQKINQNLQQYIAKNKAAKFHKQVSDKKKQKDQVDIQMKQKPVSSAKQLKQVIKQLPEYKKTIKSYNTNIQVLNIIGVINKQRNLYEQAELEHLIVTGYGGDRKQVKDKKILQKILIFLEDPALTTQDKCRLMVLGVCCLDIDNSQRNKLITRLSKVEGHGDIAMGLSKISSKGIKKYALPASIQKSNKDVYIDRHQPTLSLVTQQLLTSSSPKIKSFKIEQLKPLSVTNNKPIIKGSLSKQKQTSIQYVISMCGGLGYNQIGDIQRVIAKVNNQGNIKINFITDYIFNPGKYLEELCTVL